MTTSAPPPHTTRSPARRPARGAPLAGVRVVDLSRHLPGPLASRLLADLGARVIKIEEPRLGDPVRQAPPFVGKTGALAHLLLHGVESVALDLKQPPAREVLFALLAKADVLLASFRPGALARLGLAPDELAERFPCLVICNLSGWGETGPLARAAGHDLTYQAVAGTLASTASMPALPVADLTGAWSAAAAVLAALYRRAAAGEEGRGSVIDAGLYDAALHANLTGWASEVGRTRAVGEALPLSGELPCYQLYATAGGGHLAVAALEPPFWRRFCELIERPDLAGRLYDTEPEVWEAVAEAVGRHDRHEWSRRLKGEDLPVAVVLSAGEALSHPQAEARGVVQKEKKSALLRVVFPARFDGRRPGTGGAPMPARVPGVGEHTAEILDELGMEPPPRTPSRRKETGIGPRGAVRRLLGRIAGRFVGPK